VPDQSSRHRSSPARRAYGWVAAALLVFAVYASLIPFELRAVPLDMAWAEFGARMLTPPLHISRADFLANILLFVPVGFCLAGALLADRARRLAAIPAAMVILPLSVAFSLLLEFLQIFAPGRVTGPSDVEAQAIGCLLGLGAWTIGGPGVTAWLRAAAASSREDRLARALVGYAALWVFVNLAPFDVVVSPGDLARRVRNGLITVVPFGGPTQTLSRVLWDVMATFGTAIPLGALGLVGWTGPGLRRGGRAAFAVGAMLVVAVEAAQIFIRSHAADAGDVLVGWLGVALGAWLGIRLLSRDTAARTDRGVVSGWAVAALAGWFAVLCGYHWMPFDFTSDSADIRRRLAQMSLVPFAGHHSGSDIRALNDVLVKLALSAPLGVITTFVVRHREGVSAAAMMAGLALAAAVFSVVEAGQLFLPSRVPGLTDILLGIVGAGAGLWLGGWFQHAPRE
jgi:VanZ family protein